MYSFISRMLSLLLAVSLSCLILFFPQALTTQQNTVDHLMLMVLLLSIMIGFIHGVGFEPKTRSIRYLISPLIGWGIMILGLFHITPKTGFII